MGAVELHPHYMTRRYSEFAASIHTLHDNFCKAGMADDRVPDNLTSLRVAVESCLTRLAAEHGTGKAQIIFLINNYDQILSLFDERSVTGDDTTRFRELVAQQIAQYIEEELSESYGRLIAFVKQIEARVRQKPPHDQIRWLRTKLINP